MLQTTSEVLSFGRELEEDAARFYEELAKKDAGNKDTWLANAAENRKYVKQVERAYYSVITDALEGCFAFKIDPDKYKFSVAGKETVKKAIEIEEKIVAFYTDAAEQSKTLMADVPRALALVGKKHQARQESLKAM
jgi:hypothetical protein